MYNDTNSASGPTIVNSLFWNNKGGANPTTNGQQIYMFNDTNSGAENMTIAFSLVQHGIEATSGAASDGNANDGLGIGGGTDPVTVTQVSNIEGDPKLAADLADNGGFVQTIALLENSAAIDKGVYVRRSGTVGSFTFYYSEDSTNWFTDLTLSSTATLPGDAIDLTATDARGYTRSRPSRHRRLRVRRYCSLEEHYRAPMVLSFEGYAGSLHCADSVCAGRICFCRRRVEASFAVACFVLRQPVRDTQGGREAGLPGAYRNNSGA